jgi:hypothetical protein
MNPLIDYTDKGNGDENGNKKQGDFDIDGIIFMMIMLGMRHIFSSL